jgi:hypothetical protein
VYFTGQPGKVTGYGTVTPRPTPRPTARPTQKPTLRPGETYAKADLACIFFFNILCITNILKLKNKLHPKSTYLVLA